jgi:translation initiation factor IF-3
LSRPQFRYRRRENRIRVNNRIRAREVRVIDGDGKMLGVLSIQDALALARDHGVDLVEISGNATPPVCKLVDIGKYRYETAKREREAKKKQRTSKLKEVQIRPMISERDFQVKLDRAIGFFCNDMKVKLVLRFRGREMRFKEFGFEAVNKFIAKAAPFATPDSPPRAVGRGITVMLNPLPHNKRAKNPKGEVSLEQLEAAELEDQREQEELDAREEDFEDFEDTEDTYEEEDTPESFEEEEDVEEKNPRKKGARKSSKKAGKKPEFGSAILDDIDLEISPKQEE